jgi:hypothetical protein
MGNATRMKKQPDARKNNVAISIEDALASLKLRVRSPNTNLMRAMD